MIFKSMRVLAKEGPREFAYRALKFCYMRIVRKLFPGEDVMYAGIPICFTRRTLDSIAPASWHVQFPDKPDYEAALVRSIKKHVASGDTVVVVGGGIGVTAVLAAKATGSKGYVHCFEGSRPNVYSVSETAKKNRVNNIKVYHAIVGMNISVYTDEHNQGKLISPDKLPVCDVLELDCEGAELQIIHNIKFKPRIIIVESHGMFGSPTSSVREALELRGYDVEDMGVAEPSLNDICLANDVRVLVGVSRGLSA